MRKYRILLVGVLVFILGGPDFYAQPTSSRYIMFCDGNINTTSLGWSDLILKMYARNSNNQTLYNFQDYTWVDPFQYQNSLVQGVPQLENFLDESIVNANAIEVLGLGHCIGGLGLRLAQQRNLHITGMVLNGVPNSGSKMMFKLVYKSPGSGKTEAEKLLDDILDITRADNCDKCNSIAAFARWVKQFSDGAPHLSYAASLLSNRNYGDPTQPYINMYGLLQPSEFSFVGMLDSQGGDRGLRKKCEDERKAIERATDAHERRRAIIKESSNWLTSVLNATSGVIKIKKGDLPGAASELIKAFSILIKGSAEETIRKIDKEFKDNQEMARRLRCIMAQQLLEAEWLIMMSGEYAVEDGELVIEIEAFQEAPFYFCQLNCEWNHTDPGEVSLCIQLCFDQHAAVYGTIPATFITFTPEPNDGLYTQSEMRLASSQQRGDDIIFPGVNHFQETTSGRVHSVFFNQIFTGAQPYGPEFFVPKN